MPQNELYIQGGNFLNLYRKIEERYKNSNKSKDDGLWSTIDQHEEHSMNYVIAHNPAISYELAAAVSQFESVTICVPNSLEWKRAKFNLPDHMRIIELPDLPTTWTQLDPVVFQRERDGRFRILEFCEQESGEDNFLFRKICEIERVTWKSSKHIVERSAPKLTIVIEVDDQGKIYTFCDISEDLLKQSCRSIKTVVRSSVQGRIVDSSTIVVDSEISESGFNYLKKHFPRVVRISTNYLGYYAANNGILLVAYGSPENDLLALRTLQTLYPRRRVLQIHTNESFLNINDYILGFHASSTHGGHHSQSTITKFAISRTQQNYQKLQEQPLRAETSNNETTQELNEEPSENEPGSQRSSIANQSGINPQATGSRPASYLEPNNTSDTLRNNDPIRKIEQDVHTGFEPHVKNEDMDNGDTVPDVIDTSMCVDNRNIFQKLRSTKIVADLDE